MTTALMLGMIIAPIPAMNIAHILVTTIATTKSLKRKYLNPSTSWMSNG